MSSPSYPGRTLRVRHVTRYAYDRPVARSVHRLHLRPITDWRQRVLSHSLTITPDAPRVDYEDVFGNGCTRFEINAPYSHLTIASESVVEVADADPFAFANLPIRPASYPLVWMPWERTMLAPYLNPVELPDTQLQELTDYAMSIVQRNNFDLMEALFAMNLSLVHDFQYVQGCTNLDTTPYQVYVSRRGVCQDFANLFITMARLLGIPARYVCGRIWAFIPAWHPLPSGPTIRAYVLASAVCCCNSRTRPTFPTPTSSPNPSWSCACARSRRRTSTASRSPWRSDRGRR